MTKAGSAALSRARKRTGNRRIRSFAPPPGDKDDHKQDADQMVKDDSSLTILRFGESQK